MLSRPAWPLSTWFLIDLASVSVGLTVYNILGHDAAAAGFFAGWTMWILVRVIKRMKDS
jgi:hypothetical protein